ncbi:hypothetical protein U9M48_003986 [Paspalum notatum var. saurae]|uniref:Reverse transcriptase domain-containing protein n=1 Tax=Paspalum notatum var. saurae TaxID=547442 RepID=A0AAQ3PJS6_PASNO
MTTGVFLSNKKRSSTRGPTIADFIPYHCRNAGSHSRSNQGVIPHSVDGGLSILQYTDDTMIFMDHDLEEVMNMKLLLCAFEQILSLKINFRKSEIFCFGQAKEDGSSYAHLFSYKVGSFPFRYLGIPLHYRKLCNAN